MPASGDGPDPQRNFRFFDNRQKYLLFVNTCSEKWVVANRVSLELANIHPRPPALRAVRRRRRRRHRAAADAARDARPVSAHAVLRGRQGDQPRGRAPRDAEDVGPLHRASGDRAGPDQPRLCRRALARGEVDVGRLQHGLARGGADRLLRRTSSSSRSPTWCRSSTRTGRPASARRPATRSTSGRWCWWSTARTTSSCSTRSSRSRAARGANYDLVIASQPYRARASLDFKAKRVIAPLAKRARSGRPADRHPFARQRSRPGDHPEGLAGRQSVHPRPPPDHEGGQARARAGRPRSQFQRLCRQPLAVPLRHAHAAERDIGTSSIGTSTLFAAWNAAIYVAQVEDHRVAEAAADGRYLAATQEVLQKHGGLWFYDKSYVISRRRD